MVECGGVPVHRMVFTSGSLLFFALTLLVLEMLAVGLDGVPGLVQTVPVIGPTVLVLGLG